MIVSKTNTSPVIEAQAKIACKKIGNVCVISKIASIAAHASTMSAKTPNINLFILTSCSAFNSAKFA